MPPPPPPPPRVRDHHYVEEGKQSDVSRSFIHREPQVQPHESSVTHFSAEMLQNLNSNEKDDIIFALQVENSKLSSKVVQLEKWTSEELQGVTLAAQESCDDAFHQMNMYKEKAQLMAGEMEKALRKLELAHTRDRLYRKGAVQDLNFDELEIGERQKLSGMPWQATGGQGDLLQHN